MNCSQISKTIVRRILLVITLLFFCCSLFQAESIHADQTIFRSVGKDMRELNSIEEATIRVVNGSGTPLKDARIFRLSGGQRSGGKQLASDQGEPLTTNAQGEIVAAVSTGDKLLAIAPISHTDSYTLYITNGDPISSGVRSHIVTNPNAVQVLTVTKNHPLYLFNISVAIEWDSTSQQPLLDQIKADLRQSSQYLYDFTDGQMAFGEVTLSQNADDWAYADILIHANNRLRPYAEQGGVVTRPISETIQFTQTNTKQNEYRPGQINMGSSWDRYGDPGQGFSDDWALALAHELGHYLLFLDETYIGFDGTLLHTRDQCNKSAMGDLYGSKAATEFVADSQEWATNCANTLSNQTLNRTEWQTIQKWYPDILRPTEILTGPTVIPYEVTEFYVRTPITSSVEIIPDPSFYFDYAEPTKSSSEARAYLLKWKENIGDANNSGDHVYAIDLGTPFGDQNRIIAYGAELKDKICMFDRPKHAYGCETIEDGDDRVQVIDNLWSPVIQMTPVNSRTYGLDVILRDETGLPISLTNRLRAKIFPEYGLASNVVTLTLTNQQRGIYHSQIRLTEFSPSGVVQIWVDEPSTESSPRREMLVSFNVAGNLGEWTPDVDKRRANGGVWRGGGAPWRANRTQWRPKLAPITSPDGQVVFYTKDPLDFPPGQFFTIQGMGAIESPLAGRTVVGQAYYFTGTPGLNAVFAVTGSISIQYLPDDVRNANANENLLSIYYYDGNWKHLHTDVDTRFNLASAPSQGFGVYVLMSSVEIPLLRKGWNEFSYPILISSPVRTAMESIDGNYQTVYYYDPKDLEDHWKVFDISAPDFANDLQFLEYPKIYVITTTASVTLSLDTQPLISGATRLADPIVQVPPSMQYGNVLPGRQFTPLAGMTVTAKINGKICGQSKTESIDKTVVYAIDVQAEDSGEFLGCGLLDHSITIEIGGRVMEPKGVWDNGRAARIDLNATLQSSTTFFVYLPISLH